MGRLFLFVFIIVVVQRLVELVVANRNEKWIRNRGAIEIGASHYKWMVLMHTAFFISLLVEVLVFDRPLSPVWGILLAIFLLMQVLRVWCLSSLGKFWNTKILILPGANVQKKRTLPLDSSPQLCHCNNRTNCIAFTIQCVLHGGTVSIAEYVDVVRPDSY